MSEPELEGDIDYFDARAADSRRTAYLTCDDWEQAEDAEPPIDLTRDAVLAAARRRQTLRRVAGTVIGAVAIAGAAFTVYIGPVSLDPGVTGPEPPVSDAERYLQYSDPVAELIQDRVRRGLPTVPLLLTQIYPRDWNQLLALPPAQANNATEWDAHYTVGADQQHQIVVTVDIIAASEADLWRSCQGSTAQKCSSVVGSDGSILIREAHSEGVGRWSRTFRHVRPDHRSVTVEERIQATSLADALAKWTIPDSTLDRLPTDAQLEIPAPQVIPPAPTPR